MIENERIGGYLIRPHEGIEGRGSDVKASRRSTGGALTVIETPAAGDDPLHLHRREDECFYVLAGALDVCCGDDTFHASAGAFVFLPQGIPHAFQGNADSRILIISVPAGLEEFLREHFGAADWDERRRIGERYGIEWL